MFTEWLPIGFISAVVLVTANTSGCATSSRFPGAVPQANSAGNPVPAAIAWAAPARSLMPVSSGVAGPEDFTHSEGTVQPAEFSTPGIDQVQLVSSASGSVEGEFKPAVRQSSKTVAEITALESRRTSQPEFELGESSGSRDGELVHPVPGTEEIPNGFPIDLATALQWTAGQNPQVAFAQQRIEEAFAQLRTAEVLWVPSLRVGMNYNKHEGNIQDVAGKIIDTSRGSIYTGFGAQAVGAGSPSVPGLVMNFHLRDAIYQPRIAEHVLGARQHASQAATNDQLLETALAYTDLLEAMQNKVVADETLAGARRLAELTKSFADVGQGLRGDADRAQTELSLRQIEARRADESIHVASARLGRLLSHDPTLPLTPQEPALVAIDLIEQESELPELVALGLTNRPELAESQFLVGEAVQRLRRELHAPLVPSVLLAASYGGNGGGLGGDIVDFDDRFDFDAIAFWELRNLGLGERSIRSEWRARVEQARWRQVQVMDQVAAEIAESHAQVRSRRDQIGFAQQAISVARDSYRHNSERIRDAQGLPIEALQSIQALDQSQRQYVRAVADYNRAQFRLHRALGWPVE